MKEIKKRESFCRAREGYFLSTATRALIIGVAVIVVCIVCSLALYMSKQGKAAINTGTNQYNKMLEDYQDLNKAIYRNLPTLLSFSPVYNLFKGGKHSKY